MMWVATIGVVTNGSSALLFLRGRHPDLDIRGAFLHLASDAAITLGAFIAGAATALTGWTWLNAVVSLGIGGAIVVGTSGLLRSSVHLAFLANIGPRRQRSAVYPQHDDAGHPAHAGCLLPRVTASVSGLGRSRIEPGFDCLARHPPRFGKRVSLRDAAGQLRHLDAVASGLEVRCEYGPVAAATRSHVDLACSAELGHVGREVLHDRLDINGDDNLTLGCRLNDLRGVACQDE